MSTMGAIASTGMVCEATIHGISALSSVREWTMHTASSTPNTTPMAKPVSAALAVTQVCSNRLRGEVSGHWVMLFQISIIN
jgi:hypothetical protein